MVVAAVGTESQINMHRRIGATKAFHDLHTCSDGKTIEGSKSAPEDQAAIF